MKSVFMPSFRYFAELEFPIYIFPTCVFQAKGNIVAKKEIMRADVQPRSAKHMSAGCNIVDIKISTPCPRQARIVWLEEIVGIHEAWIVAICKILPRPWHKNHFIEVYTSKTFRINALDGCS